MRRGNARVGIEAMGQLKDTLHRLADIPMKLAREAKPGIDALLTEQFRDGKDPYGRPWAPVTPLTLKLRKVSKSSTPLTDTGKLADGTMSQVVPGRRGLRIVVGRLYGAFHQTGFTMYGRPVPARKILPEYGLPATWKRVLDEAVRRLAQRAVKRG